MANLQLVLLVGILLGWSVTATATARTPQLILRNCLAGAIGSFIGAMAAKGGTLYGALDVTTWGSAVAGALICTGLLHWAPWLQKS